MDAGSFVIALLTAAGTAAGPAPLGALPDATASVAGCAVAPGADRSDAREPTGLRTGAGLDRQDGAATSSALAEELAQELADVVAESDDPTSRRLANALAAAGFEASSANGSGQRTAATRTDDRMGTERMRSDALDRDRVDTGDRLDRGRAEEDPACADRVGRQNRGGTDNSAGDGRATAGASRSSDLDDVLSSRGSARSDRRSAPVERGGSGIAAALERGERAAG